MPRLARIVVPTLPHHVTQRGNRRGQVFFNEDDYRFYRDRLFEAADKVDCSIWCWCLMPNHVHLVLVPSGRDGLRATLAEAHRQHTKRINARLGVTGHLWQGRYGSVVMDEGHLEQAVRYVSLNPVRAGLVDKAHHWRWSSVRDHCDGYSWGAFDAGPVLERYGDFETFLRQESDTEAITSLRRSETSGRPLGSARFLAAVEKHTGVRLARRKPGPQANNAERA